MFVARMLSGVVALTTVVLLVVAAGVGFGLGWYVMDRLAARVLQSRRA